MKYFHHDSGEVGLIRSDTILEKAVIELKTSLWFYAQLNGIFFPPFHVSLLYDFLIFWTWTYFLELKWFVNRMNLQKSSVKYILIKKNGPGFSLPNVNVFRVLLKFSPFTDSKVIIFQIWTVRTKQEIWRRHLGLLRTISWHYIDQAINAAFLHFWTAFGCLSTVPIVCAMMIKLKLI